jgi:hypothetical protein
MNEFIVKNGLIVNGGINTSTFLSASNINAASLELTTGNLLIDSGSVNVTSGSITLIGGGSFIGNLTGTASYALYVSGSNNSQTASYLLVPTASTNYFPKWSSNTLTTSSLIIDTGVGVGINKSSVLNGYTFDVSGSAIFENTLSASVFSTSTDATINGIMFGKGSGSLSGNIIIGTAAGITLASNANINNIAIGTNAFNSVSTSSVSCVAIGNSAMATSISASNVSNCVAIGTNAMQSVITSGTSANVVAIGYGAMANLSGSIVGAAVAVGYNALNQNFGNANTAIGFQALQSSKHPTGGNTAVGAASQQNQYSGSPINNTSVGYNSLVGPTGGSNVALGAYCAQYVNSSSGNNTMVGANALNGNGATSSAGVNNCTIIGESSGYNTLKTPTGISYNIFLGSRAGYNTSGSYNLILGSSGSSGIDAPTLGGSNQLNLGGAIYGTGIYSTSAKIGINITAPQNTLDVLGNISASVVTASVIYGGHHNGNTSTPTIFSASAAGTAPTLSITGSDAGGIISVLTGGSTNTTGALCNISYSFAYTKTPSVVLTPYEINAATYGGGNLYVTSSLTGFAIFPGTAAFTATTQYKWNYVVIG